ncbi:uncharacterized protein RHO25_010080 [Cercospora beticola]|uniref:Uncharacterized protein n=1 Tax=Cercospora beticola TaxID=122368 RepID=A0ABZ0P0Z8_CERBT|nr:hypothetical protein RHO25_010080 [Cercospora beticola]
MARVARAEVQLGALPDSSVLHSTLDLRSTLDATAVLEASRGRLVFGSEVRCTMHYLRVQMRDHIRQQWRLSSMVKLEEESCCVEEDRRP